MAKVLKKKKLERWEDALQQFILWKQAQGLAERTLEDYRYHVSHFFNLYPEANNTKNLKTALLKYMTEKVKPTTYNLRLTYLKAFFSWGKNEGFFAENPLQGFKRKKAEGRAVTIDIEILKKLLALPDKKTFAGLRDYGLILLTLDTGIRPSEAFSLLEDDINFTAREIYIRQDVSKTRISRTLPVSAITIQTINEIIRARHPQWDKEVPVFCSTEGNYLSRYTWSDRLGLYCKKLGYKIRPYDLRHAFALEFLRNGGNALALQRTLGHTDLSMTKRYVNLTQSDLRNQHTIASPLNLLIKTKSRVRRITR